MEFPCPDLSCVINSDYAMTVGNVCTVCSGVMWCLILLTCFEHFNVFILYPPNDNIAVLIFK